MLRSFASALALASALPLTACGADFDGRRSGGFLGLGDGGGEIGADETGDEDGRDDATDDDDNEDGNEGGDVDRDDCKIEDENLGRTDVEIALGGGRSVRVSSWEEKADSPGEYVAFTLEVTGGGIAYHVKAGGEVYPGEGASWSHPNGDSGPDVSAISHIDFCESVDGGDDGDGADGGNDGADGGDDGDDGAAGEGEGEGESECPPNTEGCGGEAPVDEGDAGGDSGTECTGEICA